MTAMRLRMVLLGAALVALGLACDQGTTASVATGANRAAVSNGEAAGDASAQSSELARILREEPDPYARTRRLAELLPQWDASAIPAVKQVLSRRRAGMHLGDFELLVHFWASHDPRAATDWAAALIAPRYRIPALATSVELWAASDPAAARARLEEIARKEVDIQAKQSARVALLRGWFRKDRAGLEQYVRAIESPAEREAAVLNYAISLYQASGSDAVMQWAEAIPAHDETYKRSAYFQTASILASLDPDAARRWCESHCDGPYGVGMRQVIVLTRMSSGDDGRSILEWVASAPQNEVNAQTLVAAYGAWAKRDRDAALAWMQEQQAGQAPPWLPRLYAPYARALADSSPAEAISWAERIESQPEREDTLVQVARAWRLRDERAAEEWLARSPLPESARDAARKPDPSNPIQPLKRQ